MRWGSGYYRWGTRNLLRSFDFNTIFRAISGYMSAKLLGGCRSTAGRFSGVRAPGDPRGTEEELEVLKECCQRSRAGAGILTLRPERAHESFIATMDIGLDFHTAVPR